MIEEIELLKTESTNVSTLPQAQSIIKGEVIFGNLQNKSMNFLVDNEQMSF